MYMYIEKCTSMRPVSLQTLYIDCIYIVKARSHVKRVASPRLNTPSQRGCVGGLLANTVHCEYINLSSKSR